MEHRADGANTAELPQPGETQQAEYVIDIPQNTSSRRHPDTTLNGQETESMVSDVGITTARNSDEALLLDQIQGASHIRNVMDEVHLQSADGAYDTEKVSTMPSALVHRWYFKETQASSLAQQLRLLDEENGSVGINTTKDTLTHCVEWQIPVLKRPVSGVPRGSYEMVLGISRGSMDLSIVDSISFDITYDNDQSSDRPSEVISNTSLRRLFGPTTDAASDDAAAATNSDDSVIQPDGNTSFYQCTVDNERLRRLKLHESLPVEAISESGSSSKTVKVVMTVETWRSISTPGIFELHFLELHQNSSKYYEGDTSFMEHRPFTWFIDINRDNTSLGEIASYCFSGDGAYVAVLVHTGAKQRLKVYRTSTSTSVLPLKACWESALEKIADVDISVSWDGSQIVSLNRINQAQSTIYIRRKKAHTYTIAGTESSDEEYSKGVLNSEIKKNPPLQGAFHPSPSFGTPLKEELFVTFDGTTVAVYSVCIKWRLIWKATIVYLKNPAEPCPTDVYSNWKENLRGGRLVLLNKDKGYISTRDLTSWEKPLSARDLSTMTPIHEVVATCLSECGKYFVMATKDRIDFYLTETWTKLGCWSLPKDEGVQESLSSVRFTKRGQHASEIVVSTQSTSNSAINSYGYVVDVETPTTWDRIRCRGLHHDSKAPSALGTSYGTTSVFLYKSQTTLGGLPYADRLVRHSSNSAAKCTGRCTPVGIFHEPSDPNCLARVELVEGSQDKRKMVSVLTVATKDADPAHINNLKFPLPKDSKLFGVRQCALDDHSYLVVILRTLVLVWRISALPTGDYDLVWVEGIDASAQRNVPAKENDWSICQYQHLHRPGTNCDAPTKNLMTLHIPDPETFLDGFIRLVEIFKDADEASQHAIIRYAERFINQCLDPANDPTTILSRLCASWSGESHEALLAFVTALFGSPSFRWIPKSTLSHESSPISILIGHLKDSLDVLDIVVVVINYCIRLAKADDDLHFLIPITRSLKIALEFHKVDSSVFARTLRSFAYFPAREYLFAIDHHTVPNRLFSSQKNKRFHERKDPLMELSVKPKPVLIDPRLTPRLYVASFDMLWSNEEISFSKHRLWAFLQRALLALTFTSSKQCIYHPFAIEDLDNPALVALIRYKWMTVGFPFWLLQTVFYGYIAGFFTLEVVLNIYSHQSKPLVLYVNLALSWLFAFGAFRNLIVLAILKSKSREGSIYDHVYYFVLSISVLFSFLQWLLMFRVMKTIGGFLSVLRRTLRSIWVLLLIFAYIIFAYTIAFMKLRYAACDDKECTNIRETGPENFFLAMTFTYFMTAGMYEFVEDHIKKSEWIMHILLTSFLFVATIMLNILLGMVSHAFDSDDRIPRLEWIEKRMVMITRAENFYRGLHSLLRHDGERISDKIYDKIYYTATPQQVRKYKLKTQKLQKEADAAMLPLEEYFSPDTKKPELEVHLKEQLKKPKERMDEQSRQLIMQMAQQQERLEARISCLLAALEPLEGSTQGRG
ncbi:hypothetical protein BGZ68_005334 [Mortierella alpina]|nr:hypothetical protein BGZ68_005334 [Mortierella alpina]